MKLQTTKVERDTCNSHRIAHVALEWAQELAEDLDTVLAALATARGALQSAKIPGPHEGWEQGHNAAIDAALIATALEEDGK